MIASEWVTKCVGVAYRRILCRRHLHFTAQWLLQHLNSVSGNVLAEYDLSVI